MIKVSVCIPQHNRIKYLLKNLDIISEQTYPNIEIAISDDGSTDDTESVIRKIIGKHKYPVVYSRSSENMGYDRNTRKSMEIASGDYCIVLGNDDSFADKNAVQKIVDFLENNGLPDIGFCNFFEEANPSEIIERATITGIAGTGFETALRYYRSFSFIGGVIIKKETFEKYNSAKHDGSVYFQMYLAISVILNKGVLFFIKDALVVKDIRIDNEISNSYRDFIPRKWKEFKPLHGGLPFVINVVVSAFNDFVNNKKYITFRILKDIYLTTFPYWLINYRSNDAFVAAAGLIKGLYPPQVKQFKELTFFRRLNILLIYFTSSVIGILLPVSVFNKLRGHVYRFLKK